MPNRQLSRAFYRKGNRKPVEDFIGSLAKNEQEVVERNIRLHEAWGTALAFPRTRHIKDRLWELRVHTNGRFLRFFYFIQRDEIKYVHGVTKSRNKHQQDDIDIALGRMYELLDAE